jgi:hypothetical protein
MNDFGGFIAGLVMAVVVAVLAIYLIIFLIPIVLYAASVFLSGRHFHRQVTQKYKLTDKSLALLVVIGVCSIIASILLVNPAANHPLFIIPTSVLMFLLLAITTLGIWSEIKQSAFNSSINALKNKAGAYSKEISKNEEKIKRFSSEYERMSSVLGNLIQESRELKDRIKGLCRDRTLELKKRKLEEEYKELNNEKLKRKLKSLTSDGSGIALLKENLLRVEIIKKETGNPYEHQMKVKGEIQRLDLENLRLGQELKGIDLERARQEDSYKAFLSSRIVLN